MVPCVKVLPELAEMQYGKCLGALGPITLYGRPRQTFANPTAKFEDPLNAMQFEDCSFWDVSETSHSKSLIIIFDDESMRGLALDLVYGEMERLMQRCDARICVGRVSDVRVVVYAYKKGYTKWPDLTRTAAIFSFGVVPMLFKSRKGGNSSLMSTAVQKLFATMREGIANMIAVLPQAGVEVTFQQVLEMVVEATSDECWLWKGECEAVPVKNRTAFQSTFLRTFNTAMKTKELMNKPPLMMNAFEPSEFVAPLTSFINLDQRGSRLLEQSGGAVEWFSLEDLYKNGDLMRRYGIVILGDNTTTGFGKSQLAMSLACHYAKSFSISHRTPSDTALVFKSSTVESGKDVVWSSGCAWVLDEVRPSSKEQIPYCDEEILKIMMSPATAGSIRCHHRDLKLPAGVPRIYTSNASSGQEWCGQRLKWSLPLQRKSIVFRITKPVLKRREAGVDADFDSSGYNQSTERITAVMKEAAAAIPPPVIAPVSSSGGFFCPRRPA
jgi:hypothetical protein